MASHALGSLRSGVVAAARTIVCKGGLLIYANHARASGNRQCWLRWGHPDEGQTTVASADVENVNAQQQVCGKVQWPASACRPALRFDASRGEVGNQGGPELARRRNRCCRIGSPATRGGAGSMRRNRQRTAEPGTSNLAFHLGMFLLGWPSASSLASWSASLAYFKRFDLGRLAATAVTTSRTRAG
jgi:hypothetical protein